MAKVSIYSKITDTKSQNTIELDDYLAHVRDLKWQDLLIPIWNETDKERRNILKRQLPYITTCGVFEKRSNGAVKELSNFIAIDFDNVSESDVIGIKNDPYTYALHKSCSHTGYVCYVKIDGKKHTESFNQLAQYYYSKWNLVADPACKDISRARFVSGDPGLYHNSNSLIFKVKSQQEDKEKPKYNTPYIATEDDVDNVINRIIERGIDITSDYHTWISVAFALKDHYGDVKGYDYFRSLSQFHPKFDEHQTVKKWESIINSKGSGKATVATIFYLAKQNGINIKSERSRQLEQVAKIAKRQGLKRSQIDLQLKEGLGIAPLSDKEAEMIEALPDNFAGSDKESKENTVAEVRAWMNFNMKLWRCEIRQIFFDGKRQIDDEYVNEIWERININGIKTSKETVYNLLTSGSIKIINPARNWFESNPINGNDEIQKLVKCLRTSNPELDQELLFSWLLTVVQNVFSRPIPQMLVLTGKQRTGKTTFFRNLLPPALNEFYAESTLERGKDDEIMMCQKMIICNDEFKGQTMKEAAKLKDLLSKQTFTLRAPYGKANKDYRRVATLCGTSNEKELIFDYTGNRRIFPIELVAPIDFELYNSVDKERLWRQIYHYWKVEKIPAEIDEQIWEQLETHSEQFREIDEVELWCTRNVTKNKDAFTPTYEILQKAQENFKTQVTVNRFGRVLQKLGFEKTRNSKTMEWGYKCIITSYSS